MKYDFNNYFKKNILFCSCLLSGIAMSQVGIGTKTPKSMLDVNGDVNVTGRLFIKATGALNQGVNGQVLVSQGEGQSPTWKTLLVPEYPSGMYSLINSNTFTDTKGVAFESTQLANITNRALVFTPGSGFSSFSGFAKIPNLTQKFTVNSPISKTYFTFETLVHTNMTGKQGESIDFACGVFVDDRLIGIRQGNIHASSGSGTFRIINQNAIATGLSEGQHEVSVACGRLKNYDSTSRLSFGTNVQDNVNGFMSKSFLSIEGYEVPQKFNPIFK